MLSFLKKRSQGCPSESKWSVLQGNHDGKPMFVRRNDSAKQLAVDSRFAYRVGIAIPLVAPNKFGLPSDEEIESLNRIEDELCRQLERDDLAVQVLSITTNGMREFIFYTRDPKTAEQSINNVRTQFSSREIQSYTAEDKEWSLYQEFAHQQS